MNTSRPLQFYKMISKLKKGCRARRFSWIRATKQSSSPDKFIYINNRGTFKISYAGVASNMVGKLKTIDHEATDWEIEHPEYCKSPHDIHPGPIHTGRVAVLRGNKHRCMLKIATDGSTKLCNCCKKCTKYCDDSAKQRKK